jgi:hypothetical protein
LKANTVDILYDLKQAYFKFMRAHKLMEVIQNKAAEILTVEIVRRYKNNIEAIHSGESDSGLRITEVAHLLDLQKAFFLINFFKNVSDSKN